MRLPYVLAVPFLAFAGLVFGAPTAAADCTTTGNQTFCSFGEQGDTGPVLPYECVQQYDYYCDDYYQFRDLF